MCLPSLRKRLAQFANYDPDDLSVPTMVEFVLVAAVVVSLLLEIVNPSFAQSDDLTKRHQQMLYAVVQVQAGPASGSGTVIHSAIHGGDYETFVLTNFHVVGSAVTVEEEWDPKAQKDVKRERRELVRVLWQVYNDLSTSSAPAARRPTSSPMTRQPTRRS